MACVRSAIVLLVLLLSLIAVGDALAFARKELEAATYTERAIGRAQELREEIRSTSATQSQGIKGRKMGVKDEVKKELTKVKSSVITGANPSVGTCGHGRKGEWKIKCEMSKRSLPTRVNFAGLVPFSSDYHSPKSHPPKNN